MSLLLPPILLHTVGVKIMGTWARAGGMQGKYFWSWSALPAGVGMELGVLVTPSGSEERGPSKGWRDT